MQASTTFGLLAALKKPFINIYEKEFFENRPDWIDAYEILKNIFHCKQLDIGDKTQVDVYKSYITQYDEKTYSTYVDRYVIGKNSFGADKLFYENVESIIRNRL